jgi:integrase
MKKTDLIPLRFDSVFSGDFTEHIELNRAIGNKYNLNAVYLRQFDAYCVQRQVKEPIITKELFEGWCQKRLHETDCSHHIRIRTLKRFAVHLQNKNILNYVPRHPLPHLTRNYLPYIFTKDEINRFLSAADGVRRSRLSPLAHLVLPVLFRMLYGCGLRVSEALNLKVTDVDLTHGTILILGAKFQKDRIVPMSESLTALCRTYHKAALPESSEYFFPAPDGGRFSNCTIYRRFREALWQAGISHGGRGAGPRLHDIRHTFAVHSLEAWVKKGIDIYVAIPILCAYLGHKNLSATQQYLRLTAEALPDVTVAFEKCFGSVFPEVPNEKL